jgi:hypothetical protein
MSEEKLAEMILYIAEKSQADPDFGALKLNKLLFTIDFYAYGIWGRSISGSTYWRQPYGPVPRELNRVRDELVYKKRARIKTVKRFGHDMDRIVPLDHPDKSMFGDDELTYVDEMIDALQGFNGTRLSNWTHELRPWLIAEDREEIPYFTAFTLEDRPISREALLWGENQLKELRGQGYVHS